jgi:hypothetical protein
MNFFGNTYPSVVYTSAACCDFFYLALLIISINLQAKCMLCSSDIAKSLNQLLNNQSIKIKHCIRLFARAKVSTTKTNPEPTERNVMSITIQELPANILPVLKVCYTELVIKRIDNVMGHEEKTKSRKKRSWTTSADFPNVWEVKFNNESSSDVEKLLKNGNIVINNIFDKNDTTLKNSINISIEKNKFAELTKKNKNNIHRVDFYHYVKEQLALNIQKDVNLMNYIHYETFQSYLLQLKKDMN